MILPILTLLVFLLTPFVFLVRRLPLVVGLARVAELLEVLSAFPEALFAVLAGLPLGGRAPGGPLEGRVVALPLRALPLRRRPPPPLSLDACPRCWLLLFAARRAFPIAGRVAV
uniref:Putative secreted protein n=1 Tax=Ixodes ricinus TaxID=34613 RepID=A0A6B0UKJ4_IXORI